MYLRENFCFIRAPASALRLKRHPDIFGHRGVCMVTE